jgi:hypothetical protein
MISSTERKRERERERRERGEREEREMEGEKSGWDGRMCRWTIECGEMGMHVEVPMWTMWTTM